VHQVSPAVPCTGVSRRRTEDRTQLFPFASLDYAAGGRIATGHLLDRGCRRIAFVGGLGNRLVTAERMSGYLDEMAETGLQPIAFHGRPSRAISWSIALDIACSHPELEAAIGFNDLVALGMLSGFAQAGSRWVRICGWLASMTSRRARWPGHS